MKSKKINILVSGLILVVLSSSIPFGQSTAAKRPIDDWIENNPFVPTFVNDEYVINFNWYEFIWDCDYSGSVLEKVVGEGRLQIIIDLKVKDASCLVHVREPGWWLNDPIFDGIGWLKFSWTFEMNGEPGDLLPFWPHLYQLEEFGLTDMRMTLLGMAVDSEGLTAFVNQIFMAKTDFTGTSPNYYPGYGEFWPVEIITVG